MPDLFKVKRNVAKMVSMGAPESDIDSYIAQEGTTADDIRGIKLEAPKEKPGILSTIVGTTPEELASKGHPIQSGLLKLGEGAYREIGSPIASGASTLAFGIPKAIAKETGTKDIIYPEQQTFGGKALRFGSEAAGLIGGGAVKAATKIGGRLLPKLATEGIMRKGGRMATEGAVSGVLQTPEEGNGILKPVERAEQGLTWGALGGALPFAGKAAGKAGEVLNKSGRWVAKNVGGITDATVKTIKELGADRVFDPLKAKADYIVQDLTPRLYKSFQESVNNFTPEIQNFAEKKLGMSKNTINSISTKGTYAVNKVRQIYQDSTDALYQKIEQGFNEKRQLADKTYQSVMDLAPEGKAINVRPAIEEAGKRLKSLGMITDKGSLTQLGQSEIARDSVYGKLLDFYQSADAISGVKNLQGVPLTQGQMIKSMKANRETLVNKDQYTFLRDKLNSLYKNKPSDVDVSKVVNQFYADGEASGLKGLQQARKLQREAFTAEDNLYNKGLIKERKLDNFQKMSEAEKRQLKQIEDYTGQPFIDDLDSITASRSLDKLTEFSPEKMARDLIRARNPEWTKAVKEEYEGILGKEKFKEVYDDLMAHFANINLNLARETPGLNGGIIFGKSGLIRRAVSEATNRYYKDVAPGIEKGKQFVGQAVRKAAPVVNRQMNVSPETIRNLKSERGSALIPGVSGEGKFGYGMQHRPTEGPPANDLLSKVNGEDFAPKDIYDHPEWYANGDGSLADRQSIYAIRKLRGKPNAMVTIYRASPKNELNNGDWVSLSRDYAKGEISNAGEKVNSFRVKASDVKWAGDSLNEFGYFPKDGKSIFVK